MFSQREHKLALLRFFPTLNPVTLFIVLQTFPCHYLLLFSVLVTWGHLCISYKVESAGFVISNPA